MAQDEDLAREYLAREKKRELGLLADDDPDDLTGPSRAAFSSEAAGLAQVADWLQSLVHVQVRRGGGKPGTFRPSPRPVGAIERLKARERRQAVADLTTRLVAQE